MLTKGNSYLPYVGLAILIISYLTYLGYWESFDHILKGMHIWRQADCLALANGYFEGAELLEPRLSNLGLSGTGQTGSDFPIIYYFIGLLWKTFGKQEILYKILTFSTSISALLAGYGVAKRELKNSYIALLPILALLGSAVYLFYSNNYLVNMYALNLSIIFWFFVSKFDQKGNISLLIVGFTIILLGSLLKITALANFIALIVLILAFKRSVLKQLWAQHSYLVIGSLAIPFIILAWISYIRLYNDQNESGMFLTGILPIWELSQKEIGIIWTSLSSRINDLFSIPLIFLWLIAIVSSLAELIVKRKSTTLENLLLILSFGFLGYFFLFYQVLDQHDYYFTNWLILIPLAISVLIQKANSKPKRVKLILLSIISVFVFDSLLNGQRRYADRFTSWKNGFYVDFLVDFEKQKDPIKSKAGFDDSSRVISISDPTINATLYTLNCKGWTSYNLRNPNNINRIIEHNPTHVVVHKNSTEDITPILPLIEGVEGQDFDKIIVYKIN